MFTDGFTDLRMNHQHGQGDDSFWPSFTDIMTVIVIIFLLAERFMVQGLTSGGVKG